MLFCSLSFSLWLLFVGSTHLSSVCTLFLCQPLGTRKHSLEAVLGNGHPCFWGGENQRKGNRGLHLFPYSCAKSDVGVCYAVTLAGMWPPGQTEEVWPHSAVLPSQWNTVNKDCPYVILLINLNIANKKRCARPSRNCSAKHQSQKPH